MEELKYEKREKLKVIMLNTKNEIQKIIDVGLGGASSINIQAKDILKEAIKMEIPRIIMVHNHPSGNAIPSQTDIKFTKEVELSAKLLGLQLLDHIVIGDGTYESILAKHKS